MGVVTWFQAPTEMQCAIVSKIFWYLELASGKMRICGSADFQICKMRMVLRIFLADVTGKMRMQTQYYNLKKHVHFIEIFIVGITLRAICQIQISRN